MNHELIFERHVNLPRETIWRAWTTPALICEWFCPLPWKVTECQIDLTPGGQFRTVMQSPEGEAFPHIGCYLEIVPNEKLVWTNALQPGYAPAPEVSPMITAIMTLSQQGDSTHYLARALHKDEKDRTAHEAMGFHEGWGKAFDQLVALMQRQAV